MAEFFTDRSRLGLALFLNAGDPGLDALSDVMLMLDDHGVDCLELAVPFPDSVTDGPTIKASAQRALSRGVGLPETLDFVAGIRPRLRHLRIALLADWSHSLREATRSTYVQIAQSGVDGLLVHALPPQRRQLTYDTARDVGVPIVTTCYSISPKQVLHEAAERASAYLYLVAHYGRSGSTPAQGYADLAGKVSYLRTRTAAPIAVGFGVKTRADVEAVGASGADAVIVGSAGVACVENASARGRDVVSELAAFVRSLHPTTTGSEK